MSLYTIHFTIKFKAIEFMSGDATVNVRRCHRFMDIVNAQWIENPKKQINGGISINLNAEAHLSKSVVEINSIRIKNPLINKKRTLNKLKVAKLRKQTLKDQN